MLAANMGAGQGTQFQIRRDGSARSPWNLATPWSRLFPGSRLHNREVEDAAVDIGSAVIDPNHDRLAGFHIGDLKPGAERQGSVRGGQLARIEVLAVRGFDARAVEARDSGPFALDSDNVDGPGRRGQPIRIGPDFGRRACHRPLNRRQARHSDRRKPPPIQHQRIRAGLAARIRLHRAQGHCCRPQPT